MPVCFLCGRMYNTGRCNDCYALYQEDLQANHIPPLFVEAGHKMTFYDWMEVKRVELTCCASKKTLEETRLEVDRTCRRCLDYHNRKSRPASSEERKQSLREKLRKHSTY